MFSFGIILVEALVAIPPIKKLRLTNDLYPVSVPLSAIKYFLPVVNPDWLVFSEPGSDIVAVAPVPVSYIAVVLNPMILSTLLGAYVSAALPPLAEVCPLKAIIRCLTNSYSVSKS